MMLKAGTRVAHKSGRVGTVTKPLPNSHGFYRVRFDEKLHSFEPDEAKVVAGDLTPLDAKLNEAWEQSWPPFVQRTRGWVKDVLAAVES